MSKQGPSARPVVFRKPSYGSFGVTVIEPRQDVRRHNSCRRRSYSQACCYCCCAGLGRLLRKLMNNCETDISIRGSRPEHVFTALTKHEQGFVKQPSLDLLSRINCHDAHRKLFQVAVHQPATAQQFEHRLTFREIFDGPAEISIRIRFTCEPTG